MAKTRPTRVTDQERQRIIELHSQGLSRNAIMREVGRSAAVVSQTIKAAGLSFNREGVAAATKAKQVDNAAKRARLESDLLDDAARLREQLWQPHVYFDWGGKDHDYDSVTMPEPTPTDKRNLIQAASVAITSSVRIAAIDSDASQGSAVDQWLSHMMGSEDRDDS